MSPRSNCSSPSKLDNQGIIFKCFEFSLRDLLAALTGFLEKIFNFVLSPFRPIVDAVAAPIKKLFDPIIKMLPTPAIFFDKAEGLGFRVQGLGFGGLISSVLCFRVFSWGLPCFS